MAKPPEKHQSIVTKYFSSGKGTRVLFYMHSDPAWCMYNIKKRSREAIDLSHLEELDFLHELYLSHLEELDFLHELYFTGCQLSGIPCVKHNAKQLPINNDNGLFIS